VTRCVGSFRLLEKNNFLYTKWNSYWSRTPKHNMHDTTELSIPCTIICTNDMLNWLTSGCKKRLLWFIAEIGKFPQRSQNSLVRWNAENGVWPILSSGRHQLKRCSDKWLSSNVIVAVGLGRYGDLDARVIASLVSMSRRRDQPKEQTVIYAQECVESMSKY